LAEHLTLFATAFGAATLLPAYSELLFAGLLAAGHEPWSLWLVATAGNTLGSVVNWLLGRFLLRFSDRRWFPFGPDNLGRAQAWFDRYGVWSLLLAWAPIGGDALTFVAGVMRVRLGLFLMLAGIGKGLRYALVLAFVTGVMP